MYNVSKNIKLIFGILILATLIAFFTAFLKTTAVSYIIPIEIVHKDKNRIAIYEKLEIKESKESDGYYIIIPDFPINQRNKVVEKPVKVKCTEAQFKFLSNLKEGKYYLTFTSNRINREKGKLVSITNHNPLNIK